MESEITFERQPARRIQPNAFKGKRRKETNEENLFYGTPAIVHDDDKRRDY